MARPFSNDDDLMAYTRDSLIPILGTLYPWRKLVIRVTLAAFLVAVVASLFMKNYYKAKTVFYAASQDLFKPEKVFGGGTQEMFYYGSGEDIDRILTVGNSNEVLDYLIDSFDLWSVYKIKPGTPRARYKMREALRDNYDMLLTKQDALELTIEDTDPERAARLANAARIKIDFLVKSIIKNSQRALAASFQKAISTKEQMVKSTLDSLIHYRAKTGIYDTEGQTELLATRATEVTNAVARERAALESLRNANLGPKMRDTVKVIEARIIGLERELSLLNSQDPAVTYSLKNFNEAKGNVEVLESRYLRSYEQVGYDIEKLKFYNAAVELDSPALHLIESAEAPLFKSRPKRSVIVLAVTAAGFLFSILAVLVMTSTRNLDWGFVRNERVKG